MLTIEQISARVASLKDRAMSRDARAADVQLVRQGRIAEVYPDFFPDGVEQNVVANFIDIVARDLSEVMAPLPAINCSAASQVSPKARDFADTRTFIASNYFRASDLQVQMYSGADRYLTYGFLPFVIEVDLDEQVPRIRLENPVGAYPEFDRYGRCVAFAKRYLLTIADLVAQYPEHERAIRGRDSYNDHDGTQLEVYRYYDKDQSTIYIPSRNNYVVSFAENPIGKMMVICARRPSPDEEIRGQFDDVLGIQLLRNRFALLAMEAADKSIQAPIILPTDVQELQLGGDAIIRTAHPEGVKRLSLEIPQGAFAQSQLLNEELRVGARYPESRTGNINASVVTGQGVQALLGAFDTQIKSFQSIMTTTLSEVISRCFEVDEKVKAFNKKKTIRGVDAGSPYAIEYRPSKDIAGDYSADVRYGMLAGLNPAQGLIFMLQALGAGLISTDMAMRELPFGVNVSTEQEKIEVEQMRKGLMQTLTALPQAIPQMVMQGQDPSELIGKIAQGIKDRQNGKQLEDIFINLFPAPPPVEEAPIDPTTGQPQQVQQVDPGTGQAPSGRPDIQSLLNRMNSDGSASSAVTQGRSTQL